MDVPLPVPLLMDGATGTHLQTLGMPGGVCTEAWALEHPDALRQLQRSYVDAGSQVLLAPTFGANRAALSRHGLAARTAEYNKRLVELSQTAAAGKALVAADLSPTGLPLPLFDGTPFDELVDIYAQQARACQQAGVDLFVVETCVTMLEARSAVLAVKSVSDKPIWVTFTCDENGRTPSGTDVLAAMIVMQGMGVSAFGLNCVSCEHLLEQLERLAPYATVPLIAKPNAGLPRTENGKPVYDCPPEELASYAERFAAAGVRIFGGCCGTGPAHIAALKRAVAQVDFSRFPQPERDPDVIPCASEREARFITPDVDVGEMIECTPDLTEDILHAEEASPQGALKIAILEPDDVDIFAENQYVVEDALCIYSDVPELLERALRAYQGRAFWDGTGEIEPEFLQEMSRKYGLILL